MSPIRVFLLAVIGLLVAACGPASSNAPSGSSGSQAAPVSEAQVAQPLLRSYVALGASETYGIGVSHSQTYAARVARALRARHFLDLGIPGSTLHAAYTIELTQALAARPSLATVFFGFNDISNHVTLNAFLQDLHDLIVTLRQARARVLVIGLPDISKLPAVSSRPLGRVAEQIVVTWNRGMKKVARQTGARFLNLDAFGRELATHPNYIGHDGLHPSVAGHARLAQVVLAAIRGSRLWPAR